MKIWYIINILFIILIFQSCSLERWNPLPREEGGVETDESLVSEDDQENTGTDISSEEEDSNTTTSSGTYPSTSSSTSEDGTSDSNDSQETVTEFNWSRVLITEVVTDPQQDHSESTEANGVLFDGTPGTGTVGSSDEYVEIFNGTDASVDISSWNLNMIDGTDENQSLNDESWDTYFSNDGSLTEFGAGEFLVLGNPSGALNNSLTLELLSENGDIVDKLDVENANASDLSDESFYRLPNGEWTQGWATPGYFLE